MKLSRLLFLLLLAALLTTAPLAKTRAEASTLPAPVERQWIIDGIARKALLCLPAKTATGKPPVIFAFHGHGGTMERASRMFDYQAAWPEAIVVYMQGLDTPGALTDPESKKPGWQKDVGDQNDRDLKFFDAVLASLKSDYKIDESRVFAAGHSNGGGFTYLLWAARGDALRAVAPCSATSLRRVRFLKPKPVLHIAGENDPVVKFAGQMRTVDAVKRLNGCDPAGIPWARAGKLVGTTYPSKTGTPVVTLIHPGGHVFPAEATALVVRFFKENSQIHAEAKK